MSNSIDGQGLPRTLSGIGGWLLIYLITLGVAVWAYGRAFVSALQDPGLDIFSVPTLIVGTLFLTALTSFALMVTKNRLGVVLSRVFIFINTIVVVFIAAFIPTLLLYTVLAALWGLASLCYLCTSSRVHNTYN